MRTTATGAIHGIADFEGGEAACARLTAVPSFLDVRLIFSTPDNCTERQRPQALRAGKTVLMTTYTIRRSFWVPTSTA